MKTLVTSLLIVFSSILFAQETGSITGTVTDAATNEALNGVTIVIPGTNYGVSSALDGTYLIDSLKPGLYTIQASFIGYNVVTIENVKVEKGKSTTTDIQMQECSIQLQAVTVTGTVPLVDLSLTNSTAVVRRFSEEKMTEPGMISHNTEEYGKIDETGFLKTIRNPLSTFAADVDAASYSNARRFIMQNQLPYPDAVRVEEFINYFDYSYKQPEGNNPLSINMEYSSCPWNSEHNLVRIGLKGKLLSKAEQKPGNIVLLLDVSGSMSDPNKLSLIKPAFKLLIDQLNEEDRVAIVTYSDIIKVELPSTKGSEKNLIKNVIDRLEASGSTAGGQGIQKAYKVAEENLIKGGNNRVILATDGDFNVGISSTSELVRFVESERDKGIFLTILGFGMGNYKDERLQEIADHGNGTHAYIDNIMEAKKIFVNEITSTLFTIARDVKIQVEFNPAKISSYRLLGYENRMLNEKDFKDDKKDAGEIGAGHTVTAIYEVEPNNSRVSKDELKYQETKVKNNAYNSAEVLTVKVRYKEPDGDKSSEFSQVLKGQPEEINKTSDDHKFAAAVAEFAMLLRKSEFKGNANINSVLRLAKEGKGTDALGYRSEFISLAERAELLMNTRQAQSSEENKQ